MGAVGGLAWEVGRRVVSKISKLVDAHLFQLFGPQEGAHPLKLIGNSRISAKAHSFAPRVGSALKPLG